MVDDHSPGNEPTDDELREVLSNAFPSEAPDFERPSDDTILAYVRGNATSSQEVTVRREMLKSRSFLVELLSLMEAEADLGDPSLIDRLRETSSAPAELMARAREAAGVLDDEEDGPQDHSPSFLAKLLNAVWQPALGAAVAALVLLGIPAIQQRTALDPGFQLGAETHELTRRSSAPRGNNDYDSISLAQAGTSVDLIIDSDLAPRALPYRVVLRRFGQQVPEIVATLSRSPHVTSSAEGMRFVYRTDRAILTPGSYELRFQAVGSDGTDVEDLPAIVGRFRIEP